MTDNFKDFRAQLDGVETRKREASERANAALGRVSQLEAEFSTACIVGDPTTEIEQQLEAARAEFRKAQQALDVFNGKAGSLAHIVASSSRMGELAKAILRDNETRISELKAQADVKLSRLKDMRREFFSLVAELGVLNNEASALSREQNIVGKYVPGQENIHRLGLGIDVNGKGPEEFYIKAADIAKVFKEGRA